MKVRALYLTILILVLFVGSGFGQKDGRKPDASKGDPPPGAALDLSPAIARLIIRDLLTKRHHVRIGAILLTPEQNYSEARNIKITASELALEYDLVTGTQTKAKSERSLFKKGGYQKAGAGDSKGAYYVLYPISKWSMGFCGFVCAWKDEADAQRFADAVNRLIYQARVEPPQKDDLTPFAELAKSWRERPASIAAVPDGMTRHRVLAEQSIRDKDFIGAIVNYEASLKVHPPWAEGWFNAALLYAELGEFGEAANRMRHYLALQPDASDAATVKEKLIIWDEKAKRGP